ncbi:PPE family protein [[Mycobacterium] vasticus]|uniref:PPE family protein n=1 Tax=[Mycobacterium] vasticus TaxID=2875777 RepID=A0ABU5Z079_9MYCO|nr:PPE family protein [Mycolicibacter sp. MYC017]MEB3070808.1 PPE family protein [Mycolicibacter sp. MYC017]
MDYGVLPPEINSGRMYTGPGSGSMLTAAAAWQELSAELNSTAAMFDSVTSGLVAGPWTGPTATAMVAAAAPYVTWLRGTGAQAEQTARQAGVAAQAYATALAAVVPPPLIAANRALLHQLVASNFFGQNSPAIAEAERQYAEMWAQDAAAMYRYASSSAAASTLSEFSRPPQTTNTAGQLAQSTAVAQAGSAAATNDATSIASIIGSISPYTGVATQAASATMTSWSGTANMLSNINNGIGLTAFNAENPSGLDEILHPPFLGPAGLGLGGLGLGGRALGGAGLGGLGGVGLGGAGLSASAGNALKIGALTVPHGWAMPTTLASASAPLPAAAIPAAVGGVPGTAFGETMLGTLAGRGLGAATARAASHRRTVVPRPPAAG